MFDTHAIARTLTDEHGDHVTPDRLDAKIADVMAAIAASETRTVRWIVATGGGVIAAMRFLGG